MADISKVRAEADRVKARLNDEFKQKIARLTNTEISKIISTLENSGINRAQVAALKNEIEKSTHKNQTIARVIDAPGVLCEQLKGLINKMAR